jgi:AraC-like DNA-binding protein
VQNHLFSARSLAVLLAPDRWTVVGAPFPCGVTPLHPASYHRWAQDHVERHPNRELLIVLEGSGFQGVNGDLYPVRPGYVFTFDSMAPHVQGYPPDHPPATHLWLIFVQDRCVAMLVEVGRGRKGYAERWRRLYGLHELGLVSSDVLFPGPVDPLPIQDVGRMQVTAAVALLASRLITHGYASPAAEASRDFRSSVMATIQHHIRESNGRGCRMEDLARMAGYSAFHFHRIFREQVGMTPGQYVERCRRDAFLRMNGAGLRQKAIAEALGFAHPSALTRWRKRQTG